MDAPSLIQTSCSIAAVLLLIGIAFAFLRLLLGPSLPDRVVALDCIATMAVGVLALTSIVTSQALLLDVALAIALITFLGTIALAISLEKGVFK